MPSEGFQAEPEVLSAFGPRGGLFRAGIGLFYERLDGHAHSSPKISRRASAAIVRMASQRCSPALAEEPGRFLLAVETYYALIVKLATVMLLGQDQRKCPPEVFAGRGSWRDVLRCMESGQLGESLGVRRFPETPQYAWYLDAWEGRLDRWVDDAVRALATDRLAGCSADPATGADLFGGFYQSLLPKQVRHGLGEHYTPTWLADHVLDSVGFDGRSAGRILDPTCGSGIFLLRAIRRLQNGAAAGGRSPLDLIAGFDVNPLAVLTAKANCLLAVRDRIAAGDGLTAAPVFCRDVVQGEGLKRPSESLPLFRSEQAPESCRFDYVVGNPPWLCWDHMASDYRRQTKRLWEEYGLFSLSGSDARHGGGKKDLAMLVLYASADQFLREGGRLGMVVTQTLFQTRGAGDGFRRFRLGASGAPLAVLRVDDMVDIQPFATASNWTATIALEKGAPTLYPVPYVRWTRPEAVKAGDICPAANGLRKERLVAEPIDPSRRQSPWFVRPADLGVAVGKLVGRSDYTAHLGANTGGANGVYWVEVVGREGDAVVIENLPGLGKRAYPAIRSAVEPDLLHPLIRWGDVSRYRAVPSACLLLAQDPIARQGIDEKTMQEKYPRTCAYLRRFERQLRERAAYRRYQQAAPFYSMYNVGRYTVADHKVVWRRMDRRIRAAVVGSADLAGAGSRPVVCQETCVLIAAESEEEAHYLAALMNSAVVDFLVGSHNVRGGKGFGSPGMLEYLNLKTFDRADPVHRQLAALGRQAHQAASQNRHIEELQSHINSAAASLYGLTPADARAITSLAETAGR
ncbi:MAG: N-6 DNA methylase [Thermoguttaceae bacterium]